MRGGSDEQGFGVDDGVVTFATNGTQIVLEQVGALAMRHVDAVNHDIVTGAGGLLLDHHGHFGKEWVTEIGDDEGEGQGRANTQVARRTIGLILQAGNGRTDAFAGFRLHDARPIQDVRNRRR